MLRNIKELINKSLFKNNAVLVYGARQTGKTTLVKDILSEFQKESKYINCELLPTQRGLSVSEPEQIKAFLGQQKLVVLDEIQNITSIDKVLKTIVDFLPDTQIIATSSASFDFVNKISECLSEKTITFQLPPLSVQEIIKNFNKNEANSKLELLLRFGLYPAIYTLPDEERKIERLNETASNYLYKDILEVDGVRHLSTLSKMVQYLALRIGQDVSMLELANQIGINRLTAERYMDLLEKNSIVFRLRAFSRNKTKEVSKSFKVYFCDLGIRNSIIQNFNLPDLRTDTEAMWKNFCIVERKKYLLQEASDRQVYFYRTFSGQEVDYIEEFGEKLTAYDFKWTDNKKTRRVSVFTETYKTPISKITPKNYIDFIG